VVRVESHPSGRKEAVADQSAVHWNCRERVVFLKPRRFCPKLGHSSRRQMLSNDSAE